LPGYRRILISGDSNEIQFPFYFPEKHRRCIPGCGCGHCCSTCIRWLRPRILRTQGGLRWQEKRLLWRQEGLLRC
jgi:hypothetical protein